jgi:hypothetical protein
MTINSVLESWRFFLDTIHWLLPLTLGIVALIQLGYYTYLNARTNPPARRRQQPKNRLPDSPVMPTEPEHDVNVRYAPPGEHSLPEPEAPPTGAEMKMVILSGLPNVSEIELPGANFGIGRFYNPDKNILVALDERSVSRRHAYFHAYPERQEYYIMDTSSSYGTSLRQGEQFEPLPPGEEKRIYNGDVVQFGSTVTVRFVLPGDLRTYAR